jgi:hypothetical protein
MKQVPHYIASQRPLIDHEIDNFVLSLIHQLITKSGVDPFKGPLPVKIVGVINIMLFEITYLYFASRPCTAPFIDGIAFHSFKNQLRVDESDRAMLL